MYEINKDVVFVKGYRNGAIYDFNTGKVFSVNHTACKIIKSYIEGNNEKKDETYLCQLRSNKLISDAISPHTYNITFDRTIKLEMAWIEITQRCNLKCLHCYEGNLHQSTQNPLSTEEWKNKIDQLVELGINRLIIIGGEPCCYHEVREIITYAAQYPIDVTLFTNATLLDDNLLFCIIDNKISVKVSVYGHCAEIHDTVTGIPGSFEKMTKSVKSLIENGIKVSSSVIIMKENEKYIDEIISFVKKIGMKYSRFDVIREVFTGTQNLHIPTDKNIISKVCLQKPDFSADKNRFMQNAIKNTCWYGKIAIMENGDVIPCEFERNIKYGNVRVNTLKEIINNNKTKSKWFLSFDQIDGCKDCEYRFACKDCRPMGISVCGDIHSKNPRCLYDVYKGKWKNIN